MSGASMTRLKVTRKRSQKNFEVNVAGVEKQASPTDQTPTPTRFIRTCEEVGLFQDLQNVNPFEEGFRKALHDNNASKSVAASTTKTSKDEDDSLHTPNILPHISDVCSLAEKDAMMMPEIVEIDEDSDDPDVGLQIDQDNGQSKLHILQLPERINEAPKSSKPAGQLKLKVVDIFESHVVRRRELNRKAQQRSRRRRKEEEEKIIDEVNILRNQNRKLKDENMHLMSEVLSLRKRLGIKNVDSKKRKGEQSTSKAEKAMKIIKSENADNANKDETKVSVKIRTDVPVTLNSRVDKEIVSVRKENKAKSVDEIANGCPARLLPKPVKSHLDPSKISKTYLRKQRSILPKISNVWSMATTSTTTTIAAPTNFFKSTSTPSGLGLDLGNGVVVPLKLAALEQNAEK